MIFKKIFIAVGAFIIPIRKRAQRMRAGGNGTPATFVAGVLVSRGDQRKLSP